MLGDTDNIQDLPTGIDDQNREGDHRDEWEKRPY